MIIGSLDKKMTQRKRAKELVRVTRDFIHWIIFFLLNFFFFFYIKPEEFEIYFIQISI